MPNDTPQPPYASVSMPQYLRDLSFDELPEGIQRRVLANTKET